MVRPKAVVACGLAILIDGNGEMLSKPLIRRSLKT